jgi:cellobiose phosphorylase
MKYGKFSRDGREYIITSPQTPKPWFNYLFNDVYHALVSQTGGGYSYYRDPKSNRILRYDHIQTDRPGRYLFMRDETSKKTWSCNWQPLRQPLDFWQAVHGLGYTKVLSRNDGISAEITYMVALNDPVELWWVKIKNETKKKRNLKVFPFVEFVSGDIELESCYRNIIMLYNQADYDKKARAIIAFKHPFRKEHKPGYSFFATNLPIKHYDTRKEDFLGPYNDIEHPEAILNGGKCSNSFVRGEDMIGVFECAVPLKPKEEKEFVVILGFNNDRRMIPFYLQKYRNLKNVRKEFDSVRGHWDDMVEKIKIKTPDSLFDRMVNVWGKYQLSAITHWRGTSHYHGVEGGLGYRDTAQDSEGLLSLDLEIARKKLERILQYQYKSGHAVSGFSETEGSWDGLYQSGVIGKADVAVWLPYTVVSYIKETGDVNFLKEEFRFCDGDKATVYEHILRAIRYLCSRRGDHKLPYILKADWNDAYDHVGLQGKGESVWLAMALCRACKQVGELAAFIGDEPVAHEMSEKYDELRTIVNEVGWDGQWYIAAYNDDGMKIGSDINKEGKVPLNSQTWAILSEIVPEDRLSMILKKIDKYLDTPYGPALFLPSYTFFNPGIGRVTAFAEGTKENAAVFSHACAFKIVADCQIKRGDKAYETYAKLLPMSPAKQNHTKYKVEPYVWAEYIIGPGSQYRFGEGAFTWNTGTAPWMFIAATEWILGARREFEGLLIDPCLPRHWKECWIRRPFRGAVYEISIKNPKGIQSGVREITIDGKKQKSNIIKPHRDGRVHRVDVVMG